MKKPFALFIVLAFAFLSFKGSKGPFDGYTKMPNGTWYKLFTRGSGTVSPDSGGAVFLKLKFKNVRDSVLMDVNKNANLPSFPLIIQKPKFKGDFLDVFMKMHAGDSAVFYIRMDSLKSNYPGQFEFKNPAFDTLKYLGFAAKVDSVFLKVQIDTIKAQDARKQQAAQLKKQQVQEQMGALQQKANQMQPWIRAHNDSLLKPCLQRYGITATPDDEGIYFKTITPGHGAQIQVFQKVSVRYTGSFLDGTVFDSNALFDGQDLLTFSMGLDQMIPGFTKCVYKMHPGEKAVFILPPMMAYRDGLSRVFEVEIVNVKDSH